MDKNSKIKIVTLKYSYFLYSHISEAEAPILWLPNGKSRLIGKDAGAEKD